jgi:hypothetical protein
MVLLYERTDKLKVEASFLFSCCQRKGVEDRTADAAQKRYTLEVMRVGVSQLAQKKQLAVRIKPTALVWREEVAAGNRQAAGCSEGMSEKALFLRFCGNAADAATAAELVAAVWLRSALRGGVAERAVAAYARRVGRRNGSHGNETNEC